MQKSNATTFIFKTLSSVGSFFNMVNTFFEKNAIKRAKTVEIATTVYFTICNTSPTADFSYISVNYLIFKELCQA